MVELPQIKAVMGHWGGGVYWRVYMYALENCVNISMDGLSFSTMIACDVFSGFKIFKTILIQFEINRAYNYVVLDYLL